MGYERASKNYSIKVLGQKFSRLVALSYFLERNRRSGTLSEGCHGQRSFRVGRTNVRIAVWVYDAVDAYFLWISRRFGRNALSY